ncbi:hypothetical protein [Chromobacterium phragmitis]|uniref:hypothetical protein n=1 Tax=Chromobacterium phragmitis TaxID=2202141 RepID=UPI00143DD9C8|nr:hypothetical protein [Chromobacterium phragmitis]
MKHVEDEISLLQVLQFCWTNFRILLSGCILFLAIGFVWSMRMPDVFVARTTLMIAPPLGAKGGAALLQSDLLLMQAVNHFDLMARYKSRKENEAKLALLNNHLKINIAKDQFSERQGQLLEITVSDSDPAMAARLANYLADILRRRIIETHVTDQGRKLFALQGRLKAAQERLTRAQQRVLFDIQRGRVTLDSTSVQMMAGFAHLEGVLASVDGGNLNSAFSDDAIPLSETSDTHAEVRDFYYHKALVRALERQVQQMTLLVSEDVQVLAEAAPPLTKSSPDRSLIVLFAAAVGLGISVLLALALQWRKSGFTAFHYAK